jgi:hypothetical protein
MGPGDYKLWGPPGGGEPNKDFHETGGLNYYKYVDLHDNNRNDIRICCKTCWECTGWNLRDLPNMPDAGLDWMVKHWNVTHTQ